MNLAATTRAITALIELGRFYEDFDASIYTKQELHELAEESVTVAKRARDAAYGKHCKKAVGRKEVVKVRAMIDHALSEYETALRELGER